MPWSKARSRSDAPGPEGDGRAPSCGDGQDGRVRAGVDEEAQLGPAVRFEGELPAQGAGGAAVRRLAHGFGAGSHSTTVRECQSSLR